MNLKDFGAALASFTSYKYYENFANAGPPMTRGKWNFSYSILTVISSWDILNFYNYSIYIKVCVYCLTDLADQNINRKLKLKKKISVLVLRQVFPHNFQNQLFHRQELWTEHYTQYNLVSMSTFLHRKKKGITSKMSEIDFRFTF